MGATYRFRGMDADRSEGQLHGSCIKAENGCHYREATCFARVPFNQFRFREMLEKKKKKSFWDVLRSWSALNTPAAFNRRDPFHTKCWICQRQGRIEMMTCSLLKYNSLQKLRNPAIVPPFLRNIRFSVCHSPKRQFLESHFLEDKIE